MLKRSILLISLLTCLIIPVIIFAGPAPSLSDLQVYAAKSANQPSWEYFYPSQLSSVKDHGGSGMEIVTVEKGYAIEGLRFAWMKGRSLKIKKTEPADFNGDKIIDGWYVFWNANGFQDGIFTCRSTGINGGKTLSDSINIR